MLGRRMESGGQEAGAAPAATIPKEETPPLALILDRFCLAYQRMPCSVCWERCPVEGAISVAQGMPV